MALLANFIRLKREGFEPSRDFIMLLTGDEETEMDSVAYFANEKRDLIDAAFALNSDGGTVEATPDNQWRLSSRPRKRST